MSSATFTLVGLSNYLEYFEKDIFQNLNLPTGIDKQTCIDNIMFFAGDNELLYPDGDFMIDAIGMWSTKWYRTFQKWIDVLSEDYEPLENYDRKEAWSDSFSESSSESLSTSESSSASASDSSSNSNSLLDTISAFNTSSFANDSASQGNNIATSKSNSNGTNDLKSRTDSGHESLNMHRGRVHGNIGVTTTQAMLQQELDVQRFNIYDEIAIIFTREFTLAL